MEKRQQSYMEKLYSYCQELYSLSKDTFSRETLSNIKRGLERSYQKLRFLKENSKTFPSLIHSKGILLFAWILLKNGYEVDIEHHSAGIGRYDVYGEKKDKRIGIEVETNITGFIKKEKKKMYPAYRLLSKTARYGLPENVNYFYISYPIFNQPDYWNPDFYEFYSYLRSSRKNETKQIAKFLRKYALLVCKKRCEEIDESCFNYITNTLPKLAKRSHLDGILLYDFTRNKTYLAILKKNKKKNLKIILDFEEELRSLV